MPRADLDILYPSTVGVPVVFLFLLLSEHYLFVKCGCELGDREQEAALMRRMA